MSAVAQLPSPRLPLGVKVAYTLFLCVLVPNYWMDYGPTNFLYFCDVALFLTLAALWLESPLLASMGAVGIVVPQMFWLVDFFGSLIGLPLTSMTAYMFNDGIPLFTRALSMFHGWLPLLLLWLVFRLGYDRRAFWAWTALAWTLMVVCYVFLPAPPAPAANPNLPVNVNYVYGPAGDHVQTWMDPTLYLALLMIGFPLVFFLPAHLLLGRFMSSAADPAAGPGRRPTEASLLLRASRSVLWFVLRRVVGLRYRVRVHGLDQLGDLQGPILILPNHPGFNDPALVLSSLWPRLRPRPMLFEGMFQNPALRPLMTLLNAIQVPDLDQPSTEARQRAQKAVGTVIAALRQGEDIILWPSGRIRRDNSGEVLGGARAVSDILQAVPEANVLLVRTRGVWGSTFSYAFTGQRPLLGRRLLGAVGRLLGSLLLFLPRRRVDITLERVNRRTLPELQRETLNPWLEAWYNAGGPEAPTFVPYHALLGRRSHEFPALNGLAEVDLSRIKTETRTAVAQILADKLGRPLTAAEQQPETTLDQLGLDSLDRMELSLAVEQRFGFSGDQVPANLGQIWALAQGLAERGPQKPLPRAWFEPASGDGPAEVQLDTVAAAFVARALAHPRDVAAADDLAGVLTYERMLVGALVMSRRFARLPAANVGVMLPSSVACDLALLAVLLADKLPVVLNWTTGPANLAHAARTMSLTHVITSRAFLDRAGVAVEGVTYLFLEDLRRETGKGELLRTLLSVRLLPGRIRTRVPRPSPDQPAVVLFTSGSEKAPKAVPLTHANLFTVVRSSLAVLGLTRRDSILGFLPAFHSFGMVGTVLLPLLGGIRVFHHPDPTDAAGLVRRIAAGQPTLLMGTPTFLSHILERAQPGQLASLRLIAVGAEKCPAPVFERCAQLAPQACILEGYGITECAPVVTTNRPGANRPGSLGQVLPGVEVCVVDLDSNAVLPPDQQGLVLVSGPSVFPGYLGHEGPSPFQERDGKRWYVTGDLARQDADGFLWFAGRLKRFLKAGGEMISLPALEEPFARLYPPGKDGPRVAVEGIETETGRRIVLFCTETLSLREANARLQEEGFRGVLRLDEVRRLEAIPVLGTGKIDYKVLRALITAGSEKAAGAASVLQPTGPA